MDNSLTKTQLIFHRTSCWIRAWIEIACSLISILTLTWYRPWWDFKFIAWSSKVLIKIRMKKVIAEDSGLNEKGRPRTCKIDEL